MNKIQGPWTARGTLVFFAGNAGGFDLRNCPHAEEKTRLAAAAPDLLTACKLQHAAIDLLMAMLIEAKTGFMPTKSPCWPAVVAGNAAILLATGGAS
jgi:hypothetical protein